MSVAATAAAANAVSNAAPSDFQGEASGSVNLPFGGGGIDAKAKVAATSDAFQRFLNEADRFRQDRFFLTLFAFVFCFTLATLAWWAVKMATLKQEYAKHWPSKKDRKRLDGSPDGGVGDDNDDDSPTS